MLRGTVSASRPDLIDSVLSRLPDEVEVRGEPARLRLWVLDV